MSHVFNDMATDYPNSVWYLLRAVVYETDVGAAVQLEQCVDVSLSASESFLCSELGRIRTHYCC